MTRILQGVLDFQRRIFGKKKDLFEKLGGGQQPLALFITCSDSRISPNLLSQTEPGELFILRNAGNIVPPIGAGSGAEAATIEYAISQLQVHDVIVCGHSHCGAMNGLLTPEALATLPNVAKWLEHSKGVLEKVKSVPPDELLNYTVEQNVLLQLEHLKTHPSVADALANRTIRLHGWVYHFEKGKVDTYNPMTGKFVPIEEHFRAKLLEKVSPDQPEPTKRDTWI